MAKLNLAPTIYLEQSEFAHVIRTLTAVSRKTANALNILEAGRKRSVAEFAESMRIIKGLPPETEGGGH